MKYFVHYLCHLFVDKVDYLLVSSPTPVSLAVYISSFTINPLIFYVVFFSSYLTAPYLTSLVQ